MNKIICIGSACKDIFFPTKEGVRMETPEDLTSQVKLAFELGAKYKIENRYESLGGCAVNVACGLAKLGISPACYSKLGDDVSGSWIKNELEKNNVDTSLLEIEKGLPSDLSSIIVDEKSGDRIIFSNQKVNGTLRLDTEKMKGTEWFFIGDLHGDWENHLEIIFNAARENKIKVAWNPRQTNIHDNAAKVVAMIPFADIVIVNKDEAIELAQVIDPERAELNDEEFLIRQLKELGSKIVVITDGERGAWGFDGEKLEHADALKENAVDSTGAGDAFSSGFLAAHIKEKNLEECLRWGIKNGGSVVNFYGGVEGLLSEEKIK